MIERQDNGGDREIFEKASGVLSIKAGEDLGVRKSSLAQADNMSRASGVPITQEQRDLYALLREDTVGFYGAFSDQELLAKVLQFTDRTNLIPFMNAYPIIFDKIKTE